MAKGRLTPCGDPVVDFNTEVLWGLRYDPGKVEKIKDDNAFSDGELNNIQYSLLKFETGDFKSLHRNSKDGRLHHPWVQMKSDIRQSFHYKDSILTHVIDIRGCHPTFWASYVYEIYKNLKNSSISINNYYINNDSTIPSFIPHYVGLNVDNVEMEHKKWISFWTDARDPKEVIAAELDMSKEKVKALINSAMNGSENRLFKWIGDNYPNLFKIWLSTNLKKTGCNISKLYETDIMLNANFYLVIQELGIKIISEHDGFSVFADPRDKELPNKMNVILSRLRDYAIEKYGIPIVIKCKEVNYRN